MDKILIKEVVAPILIIFFSVVLFKILKKILKKILLHNTKFSDMKKQKTLLSLLNNILKYFITIVAFLMILEVFGVDTKAIVASLGVGVAVLGLALQDLLKDFVSGLFIVFENQFSVGDFVTIGDFTGEVIGIGLKSTRIKSYEGEVKILSNRLITEVTNHNMKDDMAVVDVSVSYEENLDLVEEVLNELCQKLNSKIKNLTGEIKLLGIENLGDSGISYRVAAPCKPMAKYEVRRIIKKEIKVAFDQHHITIPYRQVVVHNG